jgi:hypothetical protein
MNPCQSPYDRQPGLAVPYSAIAHAISAVGIISHGLTDRAGDASTRLLGKNATVGARFHRQSVPESDRRSDQADLAAKVTAGAANQQVTPERHPLQARERLIQLPRRQL